MKKRLWFAEKFVSLLIEQHHMWGASSSITVVICWKIRIFAYWTTPPLRDTGVPEELWFAEKFVSLLIEQHPKRLWAARKSVVICWKIRIFAYWTTPWPCHSVAYHRLWFAEKFVSLLIEQHPRDYAEEANFSCDLLKNSYLCLLNNTSIILCSFCNWVVICWKIRIFAYWTTPDYVEVAQYESVVSNDRNGKNPMLEGRNLNKREVSSFLLIYLHALSFPHEKTNRV